MNQGTLPVDKKPIYLCTSDPTPKPRYQPKEPKEPQRPYCTEREKSCERKYHLGQPVQPAVNKTLRTAIYGTNVSPDQGAKVKQRFQEQNPAWARSIEKYLDIVEIPDCDFRVWDVVTGEYSKPRAIIEAAPTVAGAQNRRTIRMWKDADAVALLTIEKNCTEDIQARIGNCETAASAYQELQKAFEGKTTTKFGALVDSFASIQSDDRNTSITGHIASYERTCNTFAGTISRVDLANNDGFGIGLKYFSGSDRAKTEFLLRSFPAFYANTIENIKSKEPSYDDAIRKLREYVPARQKGGRRKEATGTQDDPMVLKTEVQEKKDNGKRCEYCIAKGWKGLKQRRRKLKKRIPLPVTLKELPSKPSG